MTEEKSERERLLEEIAAFQKESGLSDYAFGLAASRNPNLMGTIKRGVNPRARTREKLRAFMTGYVEAMREEDQKAIATLRKAGGYLIMRWDGYPERLPRGVTYPAFARLKSQGVIVEAEDGMFGASQGYILKEKLDAYLANRRDGTAEKISRTSARHP